MQTWQPPWFEFSSFCRARHAERLEPWSCLPLWPCFCHLFGLWGCQKRLSFDVQTCDHCHQSPLSSSSSSSPSTGPPPGGHRHPWMGLLYRLTTIVLSFAFRLITTFRPIIVGIMVTWRAVTITPFRLNDACRRIWPDTYYVRLSWDLLPQTAMEPHPFRSLPTSRHSG